MTDIELLREELEAVKKERDVLKALCWTLAALSHVNGEVVDGYRVREVVLEMRRLSSGEAKPEMKDTIFTEMVEFINTMDPHMAEQFMRHDYRSMWDIWQMLTARITGHGNHSELPNGSSSQAQKSPWISVEDKLPIVGVRYNFINDITHSLHYGEVFGGKYMGERFGYHEFGLPGHSMTAKYYCPIPAPPESLTDKT